MASKLGKIVILNPAPALPLKDSLLKQITIVNPNQTEAQQLTGIKIDSPESPEEAASISVTRLGAQSSIPYRTELENNYFS